MPLQYFQRFDPLIQTGSFMRSCAGVVYYVDHNTEIPTNLQPLVPPHPSPAGGGISIPTEEDFVRSDRNMTGQTVHSQGLGSSESRKHDKGGSLLPK